MEEASFMAGAVGKRAEEARRWRGQRLWGCRDVGKAYVKHGCIYTPVIPAHAGISLLRGVGYIHPSFRRMPEREASPEAISLLRVGLEAESTGGAGRACGDAAT